jgi:hypothetical protein
MIDDSRRTMLLGGASAIAAAGASSLGISAAAQDTTAIHMPT